MTPDQKRDAAAHYAEQARQAQAEADPWPQAVGTYDCPRAYPDQGVPCLGCPDCSPTCSCGRAARCSHNACT